MTPVEKILSKLSNAKKSSKGWSAQCPAHDDQRASLSVSEGDAGRALVKCHAGCSTEKVCAAVGLTLADLMPNGTGLARSHNPQYSPATQANSNCEDIENGRGRNVDEYNYPDEGGNLVFQVVRYEPKDFRQRRPSPGGGWIWNVTGVPALPYRLPELLADPTLPVVVVEGEKDADNLAHAGVLATCNAGGAGKWTADHAKFLHGRPIIILPDNDKVGRNHSQQVAQSLHGTAESVRIVELPGLPHKGDVSDWLAAGGTKEELLRLAEAAQLWMPEAAQPWSEIVPFEALEEPGFPTHALPDALRRWVEAESHATQTPADLAALLGLTVCSAVLARRVEVEPRPGFREPINLYCAVLLEPGNRKSAVFSDATLPLRELEAEAIEAARPIVARALSDRRQREARLKKLEKIAADMSGDEGAAARCEAGDIAEELAEEPEPVLPQWIIDDSTPEKVAMTLESQGGRIASMSPEGGVFDLMAGRYSKNGAANFDVYLKGHSGDDLVQDRVSRKPVRVPRPAITCGYAIQPQVIKGLAVNPVFRGRGLLGRFLYAFPPSWIGWRKIAPESMPAPVREAYRQIVRKLAKAKEEFTLQLTNSAATALEEWETEVETMLRDGGHMELIRDWGSKLVGATLRLAAIMHCVEHGVAGRIDGITLAAAVTIARYLIPHAEVVLNFMVATDGADHDAQYVLRWIEREQLPDFSKRDAHQHGRRRFPQADDLDPALAELVRRGYIRQRVVTASGPGRPPSPEYEVNPAFFKNVRAEICTHNPHNSLSPPIKANSEDIEDSFAQSEIPKQVRVTV